MRSRTSILSFLLVEALLLLAVVVPVAHVRSFTERVVLSGAMPDLAPAEGLYVLLRSALMVIALQSCFALRDLYRWNVIVRPQLVVVRLVESLITVLITVPLLHYGLGFLDRQLDLGGAFQRLSIHPLLVMACAGAAFLVGYGLRVRWPGWMREARFAERVVIVGGGPEVDVVAEELRRHRNPAIDLVGYVDDSPGGRPSLGRVEDAVELARKLDVQRFVVAHDAALPGKTVLALRQADVRTSDLSSFYEQLTGRLSVDAVESRETFLAGVSGTSGASRIAKRAVDLLAASFGLVLATPLMLLTAIAIRLESHGPIFYRQERVGLNGQPFAITKFRSMRADAETASGPVWAQANDDRITRVGRWIRKLRIDELPQLWSVITNDMSLVGPRPERPFFVDELGRDIASYNQRHLVKPGVTGWAQINHSYGNTTDDAFIKLQFDLYYVKHRSLALDIAVLLRTIKVVVLQQGAV